MKSSLGNPIPLSAVSRICAGLLLLAGLIVPAGSPGAQEELPSVGKPLRLAPTITTEPETGGFEATPARETEPSFAVQSEPTPTIEGIQINRLGEMDPEAIGILGDRQ